MIDGERVQIDVVEATLPNYRPFREEIDVEAGSRAREVEVVLEPLQRALPRPRPRIIDSGGYAANPAGPPLRIFTRLDARLVLEDLYAKLELHAQSSSATP